MPRTAQLVLCLVLISAAVGYNQKRCLANDHITDLLTVMHPTTKCLQIRHQSNTDPSFGSTIQLLPYVSVIQCVDDLLKRQHLVS